MFLPRSLIPSEDHLNRRFEGRLWLNVMAAMFPGVGFNIAIGPGIDPVPPDNGYRRKPFPQQS